MLAQTPANVSKTLPPPFATATTLLPLLCTALALLALFLLWMPLECKADVFKQPASCSTPKPPLDKERTALGQLREALDQRGLTAQLTTFFQSFGGEQRCLLSYLRSGATNLVVDKAATRIEETLAFRREHRLDEVTKPAAALAASPITPLFPMAMVATAPDGCPVQFARVGQLKPKEIFKQFPEAEVAHWWVLWWERALELQRESVQRQGWCKGTYDVYDCSGIGRAQTDLGSLRVLARITGLGERHYPENLAACFVIHAPTIVSLAWRVVTPVLSEKTREKVCISSGMPESLREKLGGEAAVQAMLASVPKEGAQ